MASLTARIKRPLIHRGGSANRRNGPAPSSAPILFSLSNLARRRARLGSLLDFALRQRCCRPSCSAVSRNPSGRSHHERSSAGRCRERRGVKGRPDIPHEVASDERGVQRERGARSSNDPIFLQETITFCKDTKKNGPFLSRRGCHGFKTDEWHLRSQGNEVQFFKTDNLPGSILHQDDIITRFLAEVFLIGVSEPHRQRVSDRVEEQLYFRFHISVPFLMTAVR